MKFFLRISIFTVFVGLILLFLGYTLFTFKSVFENQEGKSAKKRRGGSEREYSVFVDTLKKSNETPVIRAYGEIKSWRSLEIRSPVKGKISKVEKIFRDGATVNKGDFLFSIDDQAYRDGQTIAGADLKDSVADLQNARQLLDLVKLDLQTAQQEKRIRLSSYKRQKKLKANGVISETSLEQAELALSNAERSLIAKKNALVQAENKIFKNQVLVERKQVAFDIAERELVETKFFAPFSGTLDKVDAVNGRLISTNERLAVLTDPKAIEVVFPLSNNEYLKILDQNNQFKSLVVEISEDNKNSRVTFKGKIERIGGQINSGNTGRQIFASILATDKQNLQPGDFVGVKVYEPKMMNVAKIPLGALGSNNSILLVNEESRLEKINVKVLRYQDDHVLVEDIPYGRKYVNKWSPQLDAGLKVKFIDSSAEGKNKILPKKNQTVKLSDEDRKLYIGMVEKNKWIPKDVKARLINQLSKENVNKKVVDRLKKRMGK